MATVEVTAAPSVPAFHVAPTVDDLKNSTLWKVQILVEHKPQVPDQHLENLAELFKHHGVQNRFAMHLIHRHDPIQNDEVMMGTKLAILTGSWTRPMKIRELDLSDLHGHIFKLTSDGLLQAYEYREGPPGNLAGVASAFFSELIDYLQRHQLTDLLGLEVIDTQEPLIEFDLADNGTVMLSPGQAKYGKAFKETGFFYREGKDGVRQLKGNTVHSETNKPGVHKVFVDGKLLDEAGLVKALREQGLIEQ